jgi:hypothetical protein
MAAYGTALPTDSATKKFQGVLADNSGTNQFVATRGVNRQTQNGETVADTAVSLQGGNTGAYATPVTVTTTATLIKGANAARKKLSIRVASGSIVYLGYDNTVTAGVGGKNIEAVPPGATWEDTTYTGAIYGIVATGGTATVKYGEVTT